MGAAGPRILVAEPLRASGLDLLRGAGAEVCQAINGDRDRLLDLVADADALMVRSRTRVDADLMRSGRRLRVVGRAGNGVDNIDLAAATERGILVVNSPTGNLLSAAEHAVAMMLALCRNIAAADASMKAGHWNRGAFVGRELQGKALGIVGLGRIGQQVAARAAAFDMRPVAHDPYLDASVGHRLGVAMVGLDELLATVDVVSLHAPLTAETRHLLHADRLAVMKPGALIVNCSRGGLVDEAALLAALESGSLGGAALDVFEDEPEPNPDLVRHPRVVATPHLGAQTEEAQERVATETASMVLAALAGSLDVTAVNLPFRWPSSRSAEPLLRLAEQLGRLATDLCDGSTRDVRVHFWGVDGDLHPVLTTAAVRGALSLSLGGSVNYVNAERLAESRGIQVTRSTHSRSSDYPQLVAVAVEGERALEIAGTVFGDGQPRVVRIDAIPLEFRPEGRLLFLKTRDVPGVVGRVGTLLGTAGVNIADIHLARRDGEEEAWTVLRLDDTPDAGVLARLAEMEESYKVHMVDL